MKFKIQLAVSKRYTCIYTYVLLAYAEDIRSSTRFLYYYRKNAKTQYKYTMKTII